MALLSWPAVPGTGRTDGKVARPDPKASLDEIPTDMFWEICRRLGVSSWRVLLRCGNKEVRREMLDVLNREGLRRVSWREGQVVSRPGTASFLACRGSWRILAELWGWEDRRFLVALDDTAVIEGRLARGDGMALRAWLTGAGRDEAMKAAVLARAKMSLRFLVEAIGPAARVDASALPLRLAADLGWMEGVKTCLTLGRADVNAAAGDGTTALHLAAKNGHRPVVRALLAADATVDATRNDGATPLYVAAERGHELVVEALLVAGAGMAARTVPQGALPNAGVGAGMPQGTEEPWSDGNLWGEDDDEDDEDDEEADDWFVGDVGGHGGGEAGQTPLYIAARKGHAAVVRRLVAAGAAVDQGGRHSPLYAAVCSHSEDILRFLLEAGAEPDPAAGDSPLCCAAKSGYVAIVRTLLDAGADVERRRFLSGPTPLIYAALRGRHEVACILLDRGASLDPLFAGGTAFGWALNNGHLTLAVRLAPGRAAAIAVSSLAVGVVIGWLTGGRIVAARVARVAAENG